MQRFSFISVQGVSRNASTVPSRMGSYDLAELADDGTSSHGSASAWVAGSQQLPLRQLLTLLHDLLSENKVAVTTSLLEHFLGNHTGHDSPTPALDGTMVPVPASMSNHLLSSLQAESARLAKALEEWDVKISNLGLASPGPSRSLLAQLERALPGRTDEKTAERGSSGNPHRWASPPQARRQALAPSDLDAGGLTPIAPTAPSASFRRVAPMPEVPLALVAQLEVPSDVQQPVRSQPAPPPGPPLPLAAPAASVATASAASQPPSAFAVLSLSDDGGEPRCSCGEIFQTKFCPECGDKCPEGWLPGGGKMLLAQQSTASLASMVLYQEQSLSRSSLETTANSQEALDGDGRGLRRTQSLPAVLPVARALLPLPGPRKNQAAGPGGNGAAAVSTTRGRQQPEHNDHGAPARSSSWPLHPRARAVLAARCGRSHHGTKLKANLELWPVEVTQDEAEPVTPTPSLPGPKVVETRSQGKQTRFRAGVPHRSSSGGHSTETMNTKFTGDAKVGKKLSKKSNRSSRSKKTWRETINSTRLLISPTRMAEDRAAFLSRPSHRFLINPGSTFRMAWDLFALGIILFESTILPLAFAFDVYPHDGIMWISTFFFTPDILLNFITGFYHNGMLIMRQEHILNHYLFGWFALDFSSTVPWEAIFSDGGSRSRANFMLKFAKVGKILRVLRLLRILKLRSLLQRVEDLVASYIILFTLQIFRLVMTYMLFCHWTACAWGWLGSYDGDAEPYDRSLCEPDGPCEGGIGVNSAPWRRRYGLTSEEPASEYLVALQFATALLTGAELQLAAGRAVERLFVTMMMIVSFLVCSMVVSSIVVHLQKINQENAEFLEHTRVIRDFMVSRGMPLSLQTKVKRYLEYQYKSRKVVHQNHDTIVKLSPFLRTEIQEHMNKAILENHHFFRGLDPPALSQACCRAQSVLHAPDDVVILKGQHSLLLHFVVRGQLVVRNVRGNNHIYLKPPVWTVDRALFVPDYVVQHTVKCSLHSELLTIRQQDLIELVKTFPATAPYVMDYTQRVLNNDPSVLQCQFCRMPGHDIDECEELTAAMASRQPHQGDVYAARQSVVTRGVATLGFNFLRRMSASSDYAHPHPEPDDSAIECHNPFNRGASPGKKLDQCFPDAWGQV